jgi:hypothetical protein
MVVVTVVSPPAGSTIASNDTLIVDVTDGDALLVAHYLGDVVPDEVIHDGDGYLPLFAAESTRTAITGGFRYHIKRADGFPATVTVTFVPIGGSPGAITRNVRVVSADGPVLDSDDIIFVDRPTPTTDITVNMPDATTCVGRSIYIFVPAIEDGTGACIPHYVGSQTLDNFWDNSHPWHISQQSGLTVLTSDGANWIFGGY